MLIFGNKKFIKSPFINEAELEGVIFDNYEHLFGPTSFFLPKAKITTADGIGTIPDGFVIDIGLKKWYLVEAELARHSVWNHIAPQVSKQLLAAKQPLAKRIISDLAAEQYQNDEYTREKFDDLGITAINVRRAVDDILESEPEIGIPIDGISNDLKEWAKTLRSDVKLWLVNKFVEFNNPSNIIYEFPEEFKPEFDSVDEARASDSSSKITQYNVGIPDLIHAELLAENEYLLMDYTPRNGRKERFKAQILEDGSLKVLNQVFNSPSYAALAGIQAAGSDRLTVNGWTSWKNDKGKTLAELRDSYLAMAEREP